MNGNYNITSSSLPDIALRFTSLPFSPSHSWPTGKLKLQCRMFLPAEDVAVRVWVERLPADVPVPMPPDPSDSATRLVTPLSQHRNSFATLITHSRRKKQNFCERWALDITVGLIRVIMIWDSRWASSMEVLSFLYKILSVLHWWQWRRCWLGQ